MLLGCGCHCELAPETSFVSGSGSVQSFASSVADVNPLPVVPCNACRYGAAPNGYEVTFSYAGTLNLGPFPDTAPNRPDHFPCCTVYTRQRYVLIAQGPPLLGGTATETCVYESRERSAAARVNRNFNPAIPPGPQNPIRICQFLGYPIIRMVITADDGGFYKYLSSNAPADAGNQGYGQMGVRISYESEFPDSLGRPNNAIAEALYLLPVVVSPGSGLVKLNCLKTYELQNYKFFRRVTPNSPEWIADFANTPCGWGPDDPNLPATITVRPLGV